MKPKLTKKYRRRSHIRRVRLRNRTKNKRLQLRKERLDLQNILAGISPEMLLRITKPIDQAIASFDFSRFKIESPEQLFEFVTLLYFHILFCLKRAPPWGSGHVLYRFRRLSASRSCFCKRRRLQGGNRSDSVMAQPDFGQLSKSMRNNLKLKRRKSTLTTL